MINKCEFWRYVQNGCNLKNPLCNQNAGAWVSSVTACNLSRYKQIISPVVSNSSNSSSSSSMSGYSGSSSSSESSSVSSESSSVSSESSSVSSESSSVSSESSSSSEGSSSSSDQIILQQPSNISVMAGQAVYNLFNIVVNNQFQVTYQWQQSVDGGITFANINPNGGVFAGVNTNVLGVNAGLTDTSSVFNNSKFRCVITLVTNEIVYSDSATLTVY